MKQKLYTIQEVASFLKITPKTLRRWENTGLINPIRTLGNQRRYRLEDIKKLERRRNLYRIKQEVRNDVPATVSTNALPLSSSQFSSDQERTIPVKAPQIISSENPQKQQVAPFPYNPNTKPAVFSHSFRKNRANDFVIPISGGLSAIFILLIGGFVWQWSGYPGLHEGARGKGNEGSAVLAEATHTPVYQLSINVPSIFGKPATFLDTVAIKKGLTVEGESVLKGGVRTDNADINAGTGRLTASNVIYSLLAGSNITITGDKQNPTISANTSGVSSLQGTTGAVTLSGGTGISLNGLEISNSGVLSVGGATGAVSLSGGTGISVSGTTISNSDTGSAQDIFKNFTIGSTTIAAGSNNDTLTFAAGSGIVLTGNSGSKTITITSNASGTLSGLTTDGILYATSASNATSTGVGAAGTVLHGTGGVPSFSAVDLTADVANVLPAGHGGTGLATTATNGQILIGNGGGYTLSTITQGAGIGIANGTGSITLSNSGVTSLSGTASQVLVNNTTGTAQTGALTLTLPQDIGTSSTPSFASLTLSAAANQLTLGSGSTGIITTATLTSGRTYTFPDATGTVCLTTTGCGGGSGVSGSGTAGQIAFFSGASVISSETTGFSWDTTNKRLGIGTDTPTGKLSVFGAVVGKALGIFNETGDQNPLTASASGVTEFAINHNGDLQFTGGSGILQTLTSTGATAKTYNFPTFTGASTDICLATGNCSGIGGIIGGSGTLNYVPKFTPDGSHIGNSLLYDTGSAVGLNTTSPQGLFEVNGAVAGQALSILNYTGTDQNILVGSVSGAMKFAFDTSGNLNLNSGAYEIGGTSVLNGTTLGTNITNSSLTQVGTLTSGIWHATAISTQYGGSGNDWSAIAQGSIPYFNGIGTMSTFGAGASGQILQSNGAGSAPSWITANGTLNYWQLANGALSPLNITNDLLLGGTATSSARFAFINNIGAGTPTASISANSGNNATYLTGAGVLSTTNGQTLQLGSSSTGNISFVSGASTAMTILSSGNVGIGTANPAQMLQLSGGAGVNAGVEISSNNGNTNQILKVIDGANSGLQVQTGAGVAILQFDNSHKGFALGSYAGVNAAPTNGFITSGQVGIGSSLPLAQLDVRTNNTSNGGIIPIASISGNTSFAGMVVDNSGVGDLFTASKSGATKFVINNAGNVQIANLTTNNGILYTNGSGTIAQTAAGSNGQCLTITGGNLGWTGCSGANLWQENSGALSPFNITDDLLLGGTATGSARFAFINNIGAGTPTASISANSGNNATYLTGGGILGTTNAQTLTLGSSSTGKVSLAGFGITAVTASQFGWVGIGTANPAANLEVNGLTYMDSTLTGRGDNTYFAWDAGADRIGFTKKSGFTGKLTYGSGSTFAISESSAATIDSTNTFTDRLTIDSSGNLAVNTNQLYVQQSTGNVGIGTQSPTALLDVNGTASVSGEFALYGTPQIQSTQNQTLTLGGNTTGDIAFQPGNKAVGSSLYLASNGNVGIGITTPANQFVVKGNGTGYASIGNGFGSNYSGIWLNGQTPTATNYNFLSAPDDLNLYINRPSGNSVIFRSGNATQAVIDTNGNLGIGTTAPLATLDVRGNSGTIPFASVSGVTSFAGMVVDNSGVGDLFTASKSGATKFVINNAGNVQINNLGTGIVQTSSTGVLSSSAINLGTIGSSYITGQLPVANGGTGQDFHLVAQGAIPYFSGTGVMNTLGAGTAGYCLETQGAGANPIWANCTNTNTNWWTEASGAIMPINTTLDLLVGGTATNSADFAVTGMSTATPVASISAFSNGGNGNGLSLNASTATIQSLLSNTLILGGNTTGDIAFQPGNKAVGSSLYLASSGKVGIGNAAPGFLLDAKADVGNNAVLDLQNTSASDGRTLIQFVNNRTSNQTYTMGIDPGGASNKIFGIRDLTASGTPYRFMLNQSGNIIIGTNTNSNTTALATLDIRGSNSGAATLPTASISANSNFAAVVVDNSGVGDIFTASKSGATKFTIQNSGTVVIGNNTNGIQFDPTFSTACSGGGLFSVYCGSARPAKQIVLSPEYAGAVLTASDSAGIGLHNGFMSSDASPSAQDNQSFRTYYQWTSTQTSLNDYTVVVRVTLPKDFSSWKSTGSLTIDLNTGLTTSADNALDVYIYNHNYSDTTPVLYDQNETSSSQNTWKTISYDSGLLSNWATAGQTATIYLKMHAKNSNWVQVGDIVLNYLSAF